MKKRLLFATFALVILVALSRLYFGAHWLKDVIGGALIGCILVLTATVSYHRRHVVVNGRELVAVFSAVLLLAYPIYIAINWHAFNGRYRRIWPVEITRTNSLISGDEQGSDSIGHPIAQYRYNRLGNIIEPLNLLLVGDLSNFSHVLHKLGWQDEPICSSAHNALRTLFGTNLRNYRYLFSPLYQGKQMRLLATKATVRPDVVLVIQLWPAGIDLVDSGHTVWIGNISFHQQQLPLVVKDGLFSLFAKQHYLAATYQLSAEAEQFKQYGFKILNTKVVKQKVPQFDWLDWGGQRLIVLQQ